MATDGNGKEEAIMGAVNQQGLTGDERRMIEKISLSRLEKDVRSVATNMRFSGTIGEEKAFEYIRSELASLALDVQEYSCNTLISIPLEASIEVTEPDRRSLECITHSMAASTSSGGYEAPLVYVGKGTEEEMDDVEVAGKIILVDGLVSPAVSSRAESKGCFAEVFINDDHLHQGSISKLYGSPALGSLQELPRSVAVSIIESDGKWLKEVVARDSVRLRIHAEVDTGWRDIPLLTADVRPKNGDGTYAFFGVHVDSWDYGGTDNAAGNAAALEIARVVSGEREELQRAVRFLFWSGHSHGRYAGSCWYADNCWQDIYDHAVVSMSIDSPGCRGGTGFGAGKVMDEVMTLATNAVEAVVGQRVADAGRPRGGEQPLWRLGVPTMNPMRSRQDAASPHALKLEPGSAWWHHTKEDTMDKVDYDILRRDSQIYLVALWRVVSADVLPFDYEILGRRVREYLENLNSLFDLSPAIAVVREFEEAVRDLADAEPDWANRALRMVGRSIIPVLYTESGQFEPDPVGIRSYIPGLHGIRHLGEVDSASSEARALRILLLRERNRLVHAFKKAIEAVTRTGI